MNRLVLVPLLAALSWGCGGGPVPNLESADPYERYLGALEAAKSGTPEDLAKVTALLKDPDPLARTGAVVALSEANPPDALATISPMLGDSDSGVRTEAVKAVARFKDPLSVAALAKTMKFDTSEVPRRSAALALGEYPDAPELRAVLLGALADPSAGVAFNAHRSLVRITGRKDLPRARAAAEEALLGSK